MPIPWSLAACFAIGVALLLLVGRLLLTPTRFLWRLAACGVLGALMLAVLNFLSPVTGISVAVNPFTAVAVGFLGVPGLVMILLFQTIL